jgi:hypothetical protein
LTLCGFDFLRNVLSVIPKDAAEMVAATIRTIFAQPDHGTRPANLLRDECARQARGLVAADSDASHDARLTDACRRVEAAVEALLGAVPERALTPPADVPGHHPGAERALGHFHGLERALVDLAAPCTARPRPGPDAGGPRAPFDAGPATAQRRARSGRGTGPWPCGCPEDQRT